MDHNPYVIGVIVLAYVLCLGILRAHPSTSITKKDTSITKENTSITEKNTSITKKNTRITKKNTRSHT